MHPLPMKSTQINYLIVEETEVPSSVYETLLGAPVYIANTLHRLLLKLNDTTTFNRIIIDNLFPNFQKLLPLIQTHTQAERIFIMSDTRVEKMIFSHCDNIYFIDPPFDFEAILSAIDLSSDFVD